MNIALSAVILFLLLLPPIAFYLAFTLGKFPKSGPKIGLLEGLMLSAVISTLLHAFVILFVEKEIRFDLIALFIGGDLKAFGTLSNNTSFRTLFQQFVLYNTAMVLAAIFTGRILRFLVNRFRWHARNEFLRLYNYWWYLFNGYKVDGFQNGISFAPFDIVFVHALVNTNAGTMIYSGFLIDFVCEGEKLDRIYLSETSKREFKKMTSNDKGNFLSHEAGDEYAIDGDTMMIPYTNIINLNLRFVKMPHELKNFITPSSIIEIME
jgi:hypothetical protein